MLGIEWRLGGEGKDHEGDGSEATTASCGGHGGQRFRGSFRERCERKKEIREAET
jgi:hypothetical protein